MLAHDHKVLSDQTQWGNPSSVLLFKELHLITLQQGLTPISGWIVNAAAQAGLFGSGPFGYGAQASAMPYLQQEYQMGIPNLAGNMPMHNGNFGFDDGMGYGKNQTQMRRDRARGRQFPY